MIDAPVMDDFTATGLAEGFIEPDDGTDEEQQEQILAAWQHLVNTGLAWRLQGWFGRTAQHLIDEGHIEPAQGEAA